MPHGNAGSERVVTPTFWRGRRVFMTGHTGFKGSWLSLWLQSLGAELRGYSLAAPTMPALFNEAKVARSMDSLEGDIRDARALRDAMTSFKPEVVIHMAAQPLVRLSYSEPVETFQTNVMGTVNVLEAVRATDSVRSVVNVTTDKCYENREWVWGYRETDPMGGFDPYSSSKGCAELVTAAYRQSFLHEGCAALASARAGNVIGGGDWAIDRLVPDIFRAIEKKQPVMLRNPRSIRPWQHVLEPLGGYLTLAERLHEEGQRFAEAWNFGPADEGAQPVEWIVRHITQAWGGGACWAIDGGAHLHEAQYLKLDCSKARQRLHWAPRWSLGMTLDRIVNWHKAWRAGEDMRRHCQQEIADYTDSGNRPAI